MTPIFMALSPKDSYFCVMPKDPKFGDAAGSCASLSNMSVPRKHTVLVTTVNLFNKNLQGHILQFVLSGLLSAGAFNI